MSYPESLKPLTRGIKRKVTTDASAYGLGGVLLQRGDDGSWNPVSLTSRQLKKVELAYPVHEKECFAVVYALKEWRHYLHGEAFEVVTDQMSLKWLLGLQEPRDRLARRVLEIQDFEFTITHAKGSRMVVPDALRRDAVPKPLCQRCYDPLTNGKQGAGDAEKVNAVKEAAILGSGPTTEKMLSEQGIQFGDLSAYSAERDDMTLDEDGVLRIVRNGDLAAVVPSKMRDEVLRHVHVSKLAGHYWKRRTTATMRGKYWWPGWQKDLATFLNKCVTCTLSEDRKPGKQARLEVVHPKRRFSHVAFDIQTVSPKTESGNTEVIAIIDVFTSYVRAVPIPNEQGEALAKALIDERISIFRPMEKLLSDRGRSLTGLVVSNLAEQ